MSTSLTTTKIETTALVLILIAVGALAGWVSVAHVIEWTMENSPAGTPLSLGRTNAAVAELLPIAAALVIRRKRRRGEPIRYPVLMLVGATAFSLTAQLAVAKPGPSGWIVSAAPTIAFLCLTKLVLSLKPVTSEPELAPIAAPTSVAPVMLSVSEPIPGEVTVPAVEHEPASAAHPARQGKTSAADPEVTTIENGLAREPAQQKAPGTRQAKTSPARRSSKTSPPTKRVRPRSLNSAAKVEAAVATLPRNARVEDVAVKAGVSVSTARRHLPQKPATMPVSQSTPKNGDANARSLTVVSA